MVIGAFIADGAAPNTGAAYVFERMHGTWVQRAKIFANDGADGDGFGSSAAISGDTIVIGAPFATISGVEGAGAAYVFHRQGREWTQEAKLPSPDPREFGDFAGDLGVSISGDTIVVADGAAFEPPSTFGAVLVYTRDGSSWEQTARLVVDNEPSFASSVSIDGDTIAVGAITANAGQVDFGGAAYVFRRKHKAWIEEARLTADDATQGAGLGFSVAVSGNLVAAGAIGAEKSGRMAGAVYVFDRRGKQQAKLVASDGTDSDELGFRVAMNQSTVLAGAENRSSGTIPAVGAAYVYRLHDSVWEQVGELIPSDGSASGLFGCSTAVDGDTILAGAGGQTTKEGPGTGEAYTYNLNDDIE
jgi:FG-GAP repeat